MNDAELHRRTHALLCSAKLARWRLSRTAAGDHLRLVAPGGGAVGMPAKPTVRQLLAAEAQFASIERDHPPDTEPAQQRTEQ